DALPDLGRLRQDVESCDGRLAARRSEERGENFDCGGFSGAVRSEESEDLSCLNVEFNTVNGSDRTELLDEVFYTNDVVGHAAIMRHNRILREGISHGCQRIPIPELKKKLDAKKNLVVVDVREPSEIKDGGTIPGAIHIPMANLEKRAN